MHINVDRRAVSDCCTKVMIYAMCTFTFFACLTAKKASNSLLMLSLSPYLTMKDSHSHMNVNQQRKRFKNKLESLYPALINTFKHAKIIFACFAGKNMCESCYCYLSDTKNAK